MRSAVLLAVGAVIGFYAGLAFLVAGGAWALHRAQTAS